MYFKHDTSDFDLSTSRKSKRLPEFNNGRMSAERHPMLRGQEEEEAKDRAVLSSVKGLDEGTEDVNIAHGHGHQPCTSHNSRKEDFLKWSFTDF